MLLHSASPKTSLFAAPFPFHAGVPHHSSMRLPCHLNLMLVPLILPWKWLPHSAGRLQASLAPVMAAPEYQSLSMFSFVVPLQVRDTAERLLASGCVALDTVIGEDTPDRSGALIVRGGARIGGLSDRISRLSPFGEVVKESST